MKRIEYFSLLADIFSFKTLSDDRGNEYVFFKNCCPTDKLINIVDKTEFESFTNHIHLLDNIKKEEFDKLTEVSKIIIESVLSQLIQLFPDKKFRVYVSICLKDSMIVRFHQKWENEEPYCNPEEFKKQNEKVFMVEN